MSARLVYEIEGRCPGYVLEESIGQWNDHCLIILTKLQLNTAILLLFLGAQVHLLAMPIRLQYAPVRVGRPRPIVHGVSRLVAVVSGSEF